MQKRFLLAGAALLLVGAGCTTSFDGSADVTPKPVVCTMDAMQCPDGSYVGRVGPRCEFAPCPAPKPSIDVNGGTNVNSRTY